ncbi:MFS general substrate transporter [Rhizoclosmatium globosum]|uniref:MFS general substrate transporter n=1 Tax=Rhizoclosmatium globosum TaxID=329046 RepID=A0A1Y2C5Y1_9FUNG|nr:MFS general substrate transporter [Rhizoclosmatium globosum]|eukprot:ORY42287.1 MFS general substrate transporter [Rhizoclosmatium globosum]
MASERTPLLPPSTGTPTPVDNPNPENRAHRLNDVRILGAAFFFIFASQSTIQTLASTVLPPSIAFNAAGTLYVSFALFNLLIASQIVDRIGCQAGLFISALTYTIHNCGNIAALKWTGNEFVQNSILIPTALLNGLGASIIWTSQGVYVAKCSTPLTLGRYTGTFFGFMWSSGVIGPIFSSTLIRNNVEKVAVFEIVTIISLIGLALLAYIWKFRPEPSNPWNTTSLPDITAPIAEDGPAYLKTAKLCLTPSMLLLMPICYATGFEQSFYGSSLPLFIKTDTPSYDLSMKLYLRATLGLIITVTAFAIGRLIDRFGARPMVITSILIHVLCQSLLLFAHPLNNLPVLFTAYACIGVSNGILFNLTQKLVGTLFPPHLLSQAYSGFKFHTSVGTAACFFFSNWGLDAAGIPEMRIWAPLFLSLLVASYAGVRFAAK